MKIKRKLAKQLPSTDLQVNCDYYISGTAEFIAGEISDELRIIGPGFYLTVTDTVLVMQSGNGTVAPWNPGRKQNTTEYTAYVFNCRFHETIFSEIATAPVRFDSRLD